MGKKKRKNPRKGKGSAFERTICKQLSLWWTDGERDDVFWRTAGSGARATTRSKKKQRTKNQYGDVQAVDPIGQPLIDLCTIEIKKGYGSHSYFDLVDKLPNETKQPYKKFIQQVVTQSLEAKSKYWLLITKRDYKETLVAMPLLLQKQLQLHFGKIRKCEPSMRLTYDLKMNVTREKIFITTLEQLLFFVTPRHIKVLLEDLR